MGKGSLRLKRKFQAKTHTQVRVVGVEKPSAAVKRKSSPKSPLEPAQRKMLKRG